MTACVHACWAQAVTPLPCHDALLSIDELVYMLQAR